MYRTGIILLISLALLQLKAVAQDYAINVTSHNKWSVVEQGKLTTDITWISSGIPAEDQLVISILSSDSEQEMKQVTVANTGSTQLSLTNLSPGAYRVKVASAKKARIFDKSNASFYLVGSLLKTDIKKEVYYAGFHKTINKVASSTSGNDLYFTTSGIAKRYRMSLIALFDPINQQEYLFGLEESYGDNYFHLDLGAESLKNQGFIPVAKHIYYLKLSTLNGHESRVLKFRYSDLPNVEGEIKPIVNVVNCTEPNATSVEYFPSITNGTAPYTVNWFVSNSPNKEDAWMKSTATIKSKETVGSTSFGSVNPKGASILVAADLGYFIILKVKDACGKEDEKIIHVICQEARKSKSSINIQLLNKRPSSE